ncbi:MULTISPECIES: DoxX family membrane protein [Modicisalibacter]|uniref:DoxX family membrane protein n=1 Tax=Modicisalibacter tunisiensis TaxID=390637 RepID=A0ABS7WWI1_9GAMM|nr:MULTISPECIES: DoxX family membrane protein [Modicisalibacter]MBZ9539632.1 DoxX family membrane protein [Modicisalibacter tunisiensis]MBZ9566967.1 DoxX family membrane protein [Modicisalibacter tunisiensis]
MMKSALTSPRSLPQAPWAHWLLRAAMASVFLYTGADKFAGSGIQGFARIMDLPWLIALVVALGEIATGMLILLGGLLAGRMGDAATRLGALFAIPILLGAIVMEHWGQWHFMATASHPLGGMMFQVTLTLIALYLMARGNHT